MITRRLLISTPSDLCYYRAFIKYCVFFLKCCDFSELCQFCCSAGVPCSHRSIYLIYLSVTLDAEPGTVLVNMKGEVVLIPREVPGHNNNNFLTTSIVFLITHLVTSQ